jgi:hypothetical protein
MEVRMEEQECSRNETALRSRFGSEDKFSEALGECLFRSGRAS